MPPRHAYVVAERSGNGQERPTIFTNALRCRAAAVAAAEEEEEIEEAAAGAPPRRGGCSDAGSGSNSLSDESTRECNDRLCMPLAAAAAYPPRAAL